MKKIALNENIIANTIKIIALNDFLSTITVNIITTNVNNIAIVTHNITDDEHNFTIFLNNNATNKKIITEKKISCAQIKKSSKNVTFFLIVYDTSFTSFF